jgi:two-component system OmpR family sensor kinase
VTEDKRVFRSLNSRLLLSYGAVIVVCLILVGLGMLLFVRSSPLWRGLALVRLEAAARATMPSLLQESRSGTVLSDRLAALLAQAAEEQEVRILLLDDEGTVRFDSEGTWEGDRLEAATRVPGLLGRSRGTFAAPTGDGWAFVGQALPSQDTAARIVLFASPQGRLLLLAWFAENLLPPLVRAGLVALVLSALMAWLVARSVARPLEQVAGAAIAIAQGNLAQRAPVSGPREVQDLAQAFNRMAARIGAVQEMQRDFVANVSHELRTPLTSIQGFSQAILDGTAGEPAAVERAARVIRDEAERLRRMVDELLNLARFDAAELHMARQPVDLGAVVARCVEQLTPQAEEAGDSLLSSAPEGLSVIGDPDWLTQVFSNLLVNAIRHTRDGRVEVTARKVDGWIEVGVTDTGEGIPQENLSRVFERFYQVDKSRRHKGGVGLGLSIVREIVRLHGGEVTVESVVGLGSRFTVRLPALGEAQPRRRNE